MDSSVSLVHIVHRPTLESLNKPPLLVLLHGVGSNENDLLGLAPYVDGRFLVISLRAPLTIQPGAYGWYDLEWTESGIIHDEASAKRGLAAAAQVINELIIAYDADPEQVYLMGFSQGAILSLGLVLSNPGKYAGAVIMSGRLLPTFVDMRTSTDRLKDFPILVIHGTNDSVLPVGLGWEIRDYLKETSVDLSYREYPMGHTVSQESLDEIATWLTERLDHIDQ